MGEVVDYKGTSTKGTRFYTSVESGDGVGSVSHIGTGYNQYNVFTWSLFHQLLPVVFYLPVCES